MEQDRSQIGNLHIERQKPKLEMEWIKVRVDCSFPRGEIEDFSIFRSHSPGCSHLQMLILFSYLGFTSHFLLFPSPTLPTASEGNCQWRHLDGNFISSLSIAPLPLELWGISTKATQKREWNPKSSSGWVKRGPRTRIYFAWRMLETCVFASISFCSEIWNSVTSAFPPHVSFTADVFWAQFFREKPFSFAPRIHQISRGTQKRTRFIHPTRKPIYLHLVEREIYSLSIQVHLSLESAKKEAQTRKRSGVKKTTGGKNVAKNAVFGESSEREKSQKNAATIVAEFMITLHSSDCRFLVKPTQLSQNLCASPFTVQNAFHELPLFGTLKNCA